MANTTKAIVTITPPVTGGAAGITGAITPSSLTSLSMNSPHSPLNTSISPGSFSAATTPLAPVSSKHCTFALTPITIPPPPNKVSFLSTAKFHSPTNAMHTTTALVVAAAAKASPVTTPISPLAPLTTNKLEDCGVAHATLAGATATVAPAAALGVKKSHSHQKLELRQSVTSQITTVEDVDEICKLSSMEDEEDDDYCGGGDDDDGIDIFSSSHRYSSSHSNSSLSSAAAVLTRDNIIIP